MIASIPLQPISKTARRLSAGKVKAASLGVLLPHMYAKANKGLSKPQPEGDKTIFGGYVKNRVIAKENIERLIGEAEARGENDYSNCAKKCFEDFEESKVDPKT